MLLNLEKKWQHKLEQLKQQGNWRKQKGSIASSLCFTSSDYLGFSTHPVMLDSAHSALKQYGTSSCASPVVSGYTKIHEQLEDYLANFFGFEAALVFSSGFIANSGILKTLIQPEDHVIADKNIHASLIDGILASGARLQRYPHGNKHSAIAMFNQTEGIQPIWWITDGVFSMSGLEAPISAILSDLNREVATIIDDAHGIGVLGKDGKGVLEKQKLEPSKITLLIGTFSKALGGYGAFALGSKMIIEFLTQTCRSYIYNTALPPIFAELGLTALKLVEAEPERREKLKSLIQYFRKVAEQANFNLQPSSSAIQFIQVPSREKMLKIQQQLELNQNIRISAIRAPSVAKNKEGFRICLNVHHTKEQIEQLISALTKYLKYELFNY